MNTDLTRYGELVRGKLREAGVRPLFSADERDLIRQSHPVISPALCAELIIEQRDQAGAHKEVP